MTADTPARVSDADLAAMLRAADNDHFLTKEYTHDACRDLRDARALAQSQAATIAELRAEVERLKEAVAMLPNKIESEGVTPRPPGASDWWATAVGERRKRKATESALATATAQIEKLEAVAKAAKAYKDTPVWTGFVPNQSQLHNAAWAVLHEALAALQEDKPHDR
jgi:hypothetical protein